MGGVGSRFVGAGAIRGLVNRAGLPLQVDDDESVAQGLKEPGKAPPLSQHTEPYDAKGYFTGVRSSVTVSQPASVVYDSLSHDLHKVFTPMTECHDEIQEDDGQGKQSIFRVVRIPFRVLFVTGNLKMRLQVEQDRRTGRIHFQSLKEGRLIKQLVATIDIIPLQGSEDDSSNVLLDAKVRAGQLPPPPFKGLVKGVMVSKMDNCMTDIVEHFSRPGGPEQAAPDQPADSVSERTKGRPSTAARSRRNSIETGERPELERKKSLVQRLSETFQRTGSKRLSLESSRSGRVL